MLKNVAGWFGYRVRQSDIHGHRACRSDNCGRMSVKDASTGSATANAVTISSMAGCLATVGSVTENRN